MYDSISPNLNFVEQEKKIKELMQYINQMQPADQVVIPEEPS